MCLVGASLAAIGNLAGALDAWAKFRKLGAAEPGSARKNHTQPKAGRREQKNARRLATGGWTGDPRNAEFRRVTVDTQGRNLKVNVNGKKASLNAPFISGLCELPPGHKEKIKVSPFYPAARIPTGFDFQSEVQQMLDTLNREVGAQHARTYQGKLVQADKTTLKISVAAYDKLRLQSISALHPHGPWHYQSSADPAFDLATCLDRIPHKARFSVWASDRKQAGKPEVVSVVVKRFMEHVRKRLGPPRAVIDHRSLVVDTLVALSTKFDPTKDLETQITTGELEERLKVAGLTEFDHRLFVQALRSYDEIAKKQEKINNTTTVDCQGRIDFKAMMDHAMSSKTGQPVNSAHAILSKIPEAHLLVVRCCILRTLDYVKPIFRSSASGVDDADSAAQFFSSLHGKTVFETDITAQDSEANELSVRLIQALITHVCGSAAEHYQVFADVLLGTINVRNMQYKYKVGGRDQEPSGILITLGNNTLENFVINYLLCCSNCNLDDIHFFESPSELQDFVGGVGTGDDGAYVSNQTIGVLKRRAGMLLESWRGLKLAKAGTYPQFCHHFMTPAGAAPNLWRLVCKVLAKNFDSHPALREQLVRQHQESFRLAYHKYLTLGDFGRAANLQVLTPRLLERCEAFLAAYSTTDASRISALLQTVTLKHEFHEKMVGQQRAQSP